MSFYKTMTDLLHGREIPKNFWDDLVQNINYGGIVPVSDNIITSEVASLTVSNISQKFHHLIIMANIRGNSGAETANDFSMRFNGDSGANYSNRYKFNFGTTIGTGVGFFLNSLSVGNCAGSTSPANNFSSFFGIIPFYSFSFFNKLSLCKWCNKQNTAPNMTQGEYAGAWQNTNPITSLFFFISAQNMMVDSRISLYGMGAF